MSKKPVVLMILDGYGLNDNCEHNAVCEAKTPVMDQLMSQCPFVKGNAIYRTGNYYLRKIKTIPLRYLKRI